MSHADLNDSSGSRRRDFAAPGIAAPTLVAVGIGGRIELIGEQIRLVKGGVFGAAVELLWLGYGLSEKTIPIRQIASVEIVKPLLLPDFIRFSYPGSPAETGNYVDDALAENALIMSWFDNRAFHQLKAWIEGWPDHPPDRLRPGVPDN